MWSWSSNNHNNHLILPKSFFSNSTEKYFFFCCCFLCVHVGIQICHCCLNERQPRVLVSQTEFLVLVITLVSVLISVLVMVLVLVTVLVSALVLGQTVGRQDAIDQGWCHNHHNWRPLSQAVLSLAQHRTRNGPHLNSPNVFIQTNLSFCFSHFDPKLELWWVSFLEWQDLKFRFYSE